MSDNIKKSTHAIIGSSVAVGICVLLYVLMINKMLPFLKGDHVEMSGESIPTQVYIDSTAPLFLYAIPVFMLVGLINFIFARRSKK